MKRFFVHTIVILITSITINLKFGYAQTDDNKLKLSGTFTTDQRLLLKDDNDWAWNETRLSLKLDKKVTDNSKFHSDIWLRNIGLPNVLMSSDLYNKGIVDPYNLEIREAYVHVIGFVSDKMDLTIGRQRIVWGTADKLNPTDNLNPLDMEDILDFGRRRGSDALNLKYYLNNDYSMQAVFLPFFQPANLPAGIFANSLNPEMSFPEGLTIVGLSDTVLMPDYNLKKSSTAAFKFKGYAGGTDFSISYVWGIDGLPFNTRNELIPVTNPIVGIHVNSEVSFFRNHIIGADIATGIGGMGFWAEAALYLPTEDIHTITDMSAIIPNMIQDQAVLDKNKPYLKYIIGGDYFLPDGSYFNLQYMHGFVHERGSENLNDYFFMQYEKGFLNEKLKVAPIGGGFIVSDWKQLSNNYALVYMPSIKYQSSVNSDITLFTVLFDGKGENMFAKLKNFNMFILKFSYSF